METGERSTKQCIISEALTLFSVRDYDSISVAEIAAAVGVKPRQYGNKELAALYARNKQLNTIKPLTAIFDKCII
jgi:hypothetical protein